MYKSIVPILLCCFILLMQDSGNTQDVHFSNYNIIPTFYNPAQTGAYSGNMRAGLIYRDQSRNVVTPYMSSSFFIDSPIIFGFTKQQWLGVGTTLFYDKAGEVSQTWTGIAPSASYHISFDKKFRNIFTIGLLYGMNNRSYSSDNFRSEDEISGTTTSSSDRDLLTQDGSDYSTGFGDLNIGILFKSKMNKKSTLEIGFSSIHVLNPIIEFNGSNVQSEVGLRHNFHTKVRYASSQQMIWEPSLWYSLRTGTSNTMIQLRNEYFLDKKGDIGFITGIGYRIADSYQVLLGAVYQDYIFSLSYDQAHTELKGSSFELGATKTFVFNKRPELKSIIYCPRL